MRWNGQNVLSKQNVRSLKNARERTILNIEKKKIYNYINIERERERKH